MSRVKVAAVQMRCVKSPENNLKKAEELVRKAAAEGAAIILLPELFEREYFCQQRRGSQSGPVRPGTGLSSASDPGTVRHPGV